MSKKLLSSPPFQLLGRVVDRLRLVICGGERRHGRAEVGESVKPQFGVSFSHPAIVLRLGYLKVRRELSIYLYGHPPRLRDVAFSK